MRKNNFFAFIIASFLLISCKQTPDNNRDKPLSEFTLNEDYKIIPESGKYILTGANKNKKAYLITYYSGNNIQTSNFPTLSARTISTESETLKIYPYLQVNPQVAELVAEGEHCKIWFYNADDESTADLQTTINNGDFSYSQLAQMFDYNYEWMIDLFGTPVPKFNKEKYIEINSDTKIDLFFCDLRKAGYRYNWGFFDINNLYKNEVNGIPQNLSKYSNERPMIYLDSTKLPDEKYEFLSVILHEFQHLLTAANKTSYSHAYTEMMSLAVEDLLQTQIGCYDNKIIGYRMSGFNAGYMTGITSWNESNNTDFDYGSKLGFIDFLMRYYGGAQLIKEIAHSEYTDLAAIIDGVRKQQIKKYGHNDETIDSLMMKYSLCVLNAGKTKDQALCGYTALTPYEDTVIIDGRQIIFTLKPLNYNDYYNLSFPQENIYLYDDRYQFVRGMAGYGVRGPVILDNSKNYKKIFPNSFNIKYIGEDLQSLIIKIPEDSYQIAIAFTD